jgi:hypothetical protein
MYATEEEMEAIADLKQNTDGLLTDPDHEPHDKPYFFDPDDFWYDDNSIGKAMYLTISGDEFPRAAQVQELLDDLEYKELTGYHKDFDTLAFGLRSVNGLRALHKLNDDDLK